MKNSIALEIQKLKAKASRIPLKTPSRTNPYEEWFSNEVSKYLDLNENMANEDRSQKLEQCCFFFTMTFCQSDIVKDRARLNLSRDDFSIEMDMFHHLYCDIAHGMFGSKWTKPKFENKLPLAIVSIDFEGSRYASAENLVPKNVHVHAIWVVKPEELAAFKKYVESPWFRLKTLDNMLCDKVEWNPYEVSKGTLKNLGGYAAKLVNKTTREALPSELLRIYPNSNYAGIAYKASRSYPKRRKMLVRVRDAAWKEAKRHRAMVDWIREK